MATIVPIEEAERHGLTSEDVRALVLAGRLRVWTLGGRRFLDPRELAEVQKAKAENLTCIRC